MSQKALAKYKELVDRLDNAFRIGPTEGEAVLEECSPKMGMLFDHMSKDERDQASKYLDEAAKHHKAFRMGLEGDMDEDMEEDSVEGEEYEDGPMPNRWQDISTSRRRELTKLAMEMSERIDGLDIAKEERCFFMAMLDNMV